MKVVYRWLGYEGGNRVGYEGGNRVGYEGGGI